MPVREVAEKLGDQGRILLRKSGTGACPPRDGRGPHQRAVRGNVDAVIDVMHQRGLVAEVK